MRRKEQDGDGFLLFVCHPFSVGSLLSVSSRLLSSLHLPVIPRRNGFSFDFSLSNQKSEKDRTHLFWQQIPMFVLPPSRQADNG